MEMEILGEHDGRWYVVVDGVELWVDVLFAPMPTGVTAMCRICGNDAHVFKSLALIENIVQAYTGQRYFGLTQQRECMLSEHIGANHQQKNQYCSECIEKFKNFEVRPW